MRRLHRDKVHVDWVKAYISIWTALQHYIKEHHTTGLTWSKTVSFHQRKEEERGKKKKEITATLNIKSSSQVIKCNLTHELTPLP